MYWEKEIETLPRESLLELQLARLKESLKKTSDSHFYGKVFKEMGFDPSKLHSVEDLHHIPFTTKEDLRQNWPYGFIAVPKKKLIRVHLSSEIADMPGAGPNFMIILEREGLNDHMIIKVEVQKEFFSGNLKQLENLRQKIIETLKTDIPITPKVKLVEPNTLTKTTGQSSRVIDNRKDLYF